MKWFVIIAKVLKMKQMKVPLSVKSSFAFINDIGVNSSMSNQENNIFLWSFVSN